MKHRNVPDTLTQAWSLASKDRPGKKSYFCTSRSHVTNILCLLELSQESQYVQSPESMQKKKQQTDLLESEAPKRPFFKIPLLWQDSLEWGRDEQSGWVIRKVLFWTELI